MHLLSPELLPDFSTMKSNIVLHSGGRCGSFRLLDLLMNNNDNFSVELAGESDKCVFEYHHIGRWTNARHIMVQDLQATNANGKYWVIKSGGMLNIIELLDSNFSNLQHLGLVRLNITKIVASYIIAFLTKSWHLVNNDSETESMIDTAIARSLNDTDRLSILVKIFLNRALTYNFSTLSTWHCKNQNFPVLTYELLERKAEDYFKITDSVTSVSTDKNIQPTVRQITPVTDHHNLLMNFVRELIPSRTIESLNTLSELKFEV